HQLVDHERLRGDRGRIVRIRLRAHTMQKEMVKASDEAAPRPEGKAVAHQGPDDGDHRHHGKALHHGGQHVLLADQAAVKQRESRSGHHQHESGAGQHPRVVGGTLGVSHALFQEKQTLALRIGGLWRGAIRARLREQGLRNANSYENRQTENCSFCHKSRVLPGTKTPASINTIYPATASSGKLKIFIAPMETMNRPDGFSAAWLDPGAKRPDRIAELLKPLDARLMRCYPVSERVNRVENDDPECAREVLLPRSTTQQTLF